jgi:hypothetical protein
MRGGWPRYAWFAAGAVHAAERFSVAAEPHPEGGMRHAEMLRTIVRGITTAEANLGRVALQDALHFKLPRQAVNDFVEVQCGLYAGQNFACGVCQLQIGDEPEGICHGDDTALQLDPVPGDAGRMVCGRVAP